MAVAVAAVVAAAIAVSMAAVVVLAAALSVAVALVCALKAPAAVVRVTSDCILKVPQAETMPCRFHADHAESSNCQIPRLMLPSSATCLDLYCLFRDESVCILLFGSESLMMVRLNFNFTRALLLRCLLNEQSGTGIVVIYEILGYS